MIEVIVGAVILIVLSGMKSTLIRLEKQQQAIEKRFKDLNQILAKNQSSSTPPSSPDLPFSGSPVPDSSTPHSPVPPGSPVLPFSSCSVPDPEPPRPSTPLSSPVLPLSSHATPDPEKPLTPLPPRSPILNLPSPHRPSDTPYTPSRVEVILRQIWNWILMGSDRRNPDVSLEYQIATTGCFAPEFLQRYSVSHTSSSGRSNRTFCPLVRVSVWRSYSDASCWFRDCAC